MRLITGDRKKEEKEELTLMLEECKFQMYQDVVVRISAPPCTGSSQVLQIFDF